MTGTTTNKICALAAAALASLVALTPPITAYAQRPDGLTPRSANARQYDSCIALARQNPKAAHESALAWRRKGGGEAALHCVAVALVGLGQHEQAGQMMEELAARTESARPGLKAGLLSQAANAWLISGNPKRAERLLSDAVRLSPRNVDILLDRSVVRAAQKSYWEALDDLNEALSIDPDRVDALTFRANAWRQVDALDLAESDIAAALKRRPDYPEGLLERGLIHKVRGNRAGARQDWLRILEIAVEGPLTEAARRNLEILDVRK